MKNEEAKLKTTSTLIKIARKHFAEYGYFDVSLEKIAEEGAVTRGAVYHHFKNKKGLFLAVLESVQKDVAKYVLKEAMKSNEPWLDTNLMACSISGATNELALNYSLYKGADNNNAIVDTISRLVEGFKKVNI